MIENNLPKPILIFIALIQGLSLLLLHQSIEYQFWPHEAPQWQFPLFTIAIAAPLIFLLSINRDNFKTVSIWIAGFIGLSAFVGYYTGSQTVPQKLLGIEGLIFAYIISLSIAVFKFLMYTQQSAARKPLSYSLLFLFSWRNFLTLALSVLFTLAFWGILMLWAALFKMINIEFFYDLFTNEWFFYPILAIANGFGVIIFRNQQKVIDTITRIQQALMKFLLLVLIFVLIIFLLALPFTGLEPLWQTKSGSALILWLQALTLFFLNAVYQDEVHECPYHILLHRFIYFGIALLPIYSAISFYGLSIRIAQYGWTVERCWGILIWAIFTLFSLGYLWGILKRRDQWIEKLSWVNIRMGLLVLSLMFLVNSPLLDFRQISADSQMARLTSGEATYENFDYRYFQRHLAKPGYEALQKLKENIKNSYPAIITKIDETYKNPWKTSSLLSKTALIKSLQVWPEAETLPESLMEPIYNYAKENRWQFKGSASIYLLVTDLNLDGNKDYLLISDKGHGNGQLFYLEKEQWQNSRTFSKGEWNFNNINQSLKKNDIKVVPNQWHNLKIGEITLKVHDN